jgi:hypothetical protein
LINPIRNEVGFHGECMADKQGAQRALVGKQRERNNMEDLDIDGRMILKWILEK